MIVSTQLSGVINRPGHNTMDHVPLPGLYMKPHLSAVRREHLRLELLFNYDDPDHNSKGSINLNNKSHRNADIAPVILE